MSRQIPIYTPTPGFRTRLDTFRDYVNHMFNLQLKDYHELHEFSVTRLNDFWISIWKYTGIRASVQPLRALKDGNLPMHPPPTFFPGARLNYAENLLCGADEAVAVIEINELNIHNPKRYTWKDLKVLVARYIGVLTRLNCQKNDVIVVIGGNTVCSLGLLLATASIGAIFASFATDIGEKALLDRIGLLQPQVMIVECSYHYSGKLNDISDKIRAAVDRVGCKLVLSKAGGSCIGGSYMLRDLLREETESDLAFEQVPFNHPFVVMFSSGTTGTPKGIVHGQGGLIINGIKEHMLHNNFGPKDIHFHYSGIGWTLWNISIGAMFCQTTMVLYDGSPSFPSYDEFLQAVFATGVTGYGGSPRYFSELQARNVRPKKYAKTMHTLLSTGALLTPGTANWLAEAFGPVCQIGFSGGTELCGNFVTGTRSMPCYAGEIAVKELGMDVRAYGADGKSVPDGEAGELVCKKSFPNMPVMFWKDLNGDRYRKSYFEGFKDVWTHGDLIRINPVTKGISVLGRSDGVLNPSGVRFGTSELYNVLSSSRFSTITLDGLAVGLQRTLGRYPDPAERVVLFLKVASEHRSGLTTPRRELVEDLREQIIKDHSRRHVPHFFFEVDEIPYNANGKKMEIQVKQICNAGATALERMSLSDREREMLQKFVKFHDVEAMAQSDTPIAKL